MTRHHHSPWPSGPVPSVLTLACLAMMSTSAWSLGVGRPQIASSLGQPLNLMFPVQLAPGETVTSDCVKAEVTAGDSMLQPSSLQWQLEVDGQRLRGVRLRSAQTIQEPLVSVTLSIGCPARMTRQYTAFIDPPGMSAEPLIDTGPPPAQTLSPAFEAIASSRPSRPAAAGADGIGPRSVAVAVGESDSAAPTPPAAGSAPARARRPVIRQVDEQRPGADEAVAAAPPPAPRPKRKRAAPAPAQSRLSLDPAEALMAGPTPAQQASAAAEAAASAASAAAQAQAQLATMEKRVSDLQAEQRRTQAALQTLRQELDEARQNGGDKSSAWLLGLTLLSLAMAASSLLLWRGRKPQRKDPETSWWGEPGAPVPTPPEIGVSKVAYPNTQPGAHPDAPAAGSPSVPAGAHGAAHAAALAAAALVAEDRAQAAAAHAQGPSTMPMPLSITDPDRTMTLPPRTAAGVPSLNSRSMAPAPSPTSAADDALLALASLDAMEPSLSLEMHEPPGDTRPVPLLAELNGHGTVTVEELIDLEQQVDFFLVLGQDDAAIELLSSRLGERAAASGLPYLKLMELYQRRGDKAAFERVAQRFGVQFRARPPAWSEDLNEGVGLEAHPELLGRLEGAWPEPDGSMSLLQDLLSHHQEYSGDLGLPAYRDLLLLYAVARDRSEHEVRAQDIDVFLPLDATAPADMMATMMWQSPPPAPGAPVQRPGVPQSLDLDLTLAEDEDDGPKPPKAY